MQGERQMTACTHPPLATLGLSTHPFILVDEEHSDTV